MKKWNGRNLRIITAICYTLVIIYFSLIDLKPLGTNPVGELFLEIHFVGEGFIVHLIAYFLMGYLWRRSRLNLVNSFLICFLIGLTIEIAQSFTSTRMFSLVDSLANGLGSMLGIMLYSYLAAHSTGFGKMRRLII